MECSCVQTRVKSKLIGKGKTAVSIAKLHKSERKLGLAVRSLAAAPPIAYDRFPRLSLHWLYQLSSLTAVLFMSSS